MVDTANFESTSKLSQYLSRLPGLFFLVGGLICLTGISQAILHLFGDGSVVTALFQFIFVGIPGATLMFAGYWLPRSGISPQYYLRVITWIVGGTGVMFGFILLRDLHPGVTVEWSVGTQSIALMIGSIGGLLIGVEESRVTIRTKELEERTRKLKDREQHLENQKERLEEFANVVSHDLRNPLNVANARLELAQDDCDSKHLSHVESANERMEALITDLLTLAQQGQTPSEQTMIELSDLVDTCWTTVQTESAAINVVTHSTIRAEESRLRQLFENLFRNSVEHGSSDVRITVGDLNDGFYVEDDGPGIPSDERDAVFESGHSTSAQGTGFGLSIVKQIVDSHEWEIQVVEGSTGGARFEVTNVEFVAE
ncbi:HAMP domain-containing sensor histidine kinase [Halovenus sp. HT40]|uniref:HAMP domain-containing sensor histidine kinase n=1 Tax=Halovenus sp. HT40 TaxID=3126691 RepID=UPI00300F6CE8